MSEIAKAGWVFLGAGFGGVIRFLIQQTSNQRFPDFPWGTLFINILGSFLIGLYLGWESTKSDPGAWRFLIPTGLLGGFTTFSAFSGETLRLWHAGSRLGTFGYVAGSVLVSIAACAVGMALSGSKVR